MLQVHFLQEDHEIHIMRPAKFNITQLKNGNYVLSNFQDHNRLKSVLTKWDKKHKTVPSPDEKYHTLLEKYKKVHYEKIENKTFWEDCPSDIHSNLTLESFVIEKKIQEKHNVLLGKTSQILDDEQDFTEEEIFNKKMETLYGNQLFVGCIGGYLYDYSMNEKRIAHKFVKILNHGIVSMAATFDNKTFFVCDVNRNFREFDIATRNQVHNFEIKSAISCVVTYDNQFLITFNNDDESNNLIKWSIQTKQKLYSWNSTKNQRVNLQSCSQDSRYQFIGCSDRWLEIFDIHRHQTLRNIKALPGVIYSVAFTQDNQGAYISDAKGWVKLIKWKPNASSKEDFDFIQKPTKIDENIRITDLCLTGDCKSLLVGSKGLMSVFDIEAMEVTKEFELTDIVVGIKLINDGKNAIIAEVNGDLTIIDLETMEIIQSNKIFTKYKELDFIKII